MDEATGEMTYLLVGKPAEVDALIAAAQDAGHLRDITHTLMALDWASPIPVL